MGILVHKDTKVIVQGITGKAAAFHTQQMIDYGTKVVGGVTPGKGGQIACGVPVFNTVREAVEATGATASVIYVPARFAADSIMEAVDADLEVVVCISEHIPVQDMIKVRRYMEGRRTHLIGPNCPGILTAAGIGQTTAIGIGGDPVKGTDFIDALKLFKEDPETLAVLMIGEIGGTAEEDAAKWIAANMPDKPVAAFIAGRQAPPGKRMGHAGAIISGGKGTAADKIKALHEVGIEVADTVADIGETVVKTLKAHGLYDKCHTC